MGRVRVMPIAGTNPQERRAERLEIPGHIQRRLDTAVAHGVSSAARWGAEQPHLSEEAFDKLAAQSLGTPPGAAVQREELAELHSIAASRTRAGIDSARRLDADGGWHAWQGYVELIRSSQGDAAASTAGALLRSSLDRTDDTVAALKKSFQRPRPFEADPSLDTSADRPPGKDSFPSGHASGAFAAATTLAALMPQKKAELMDLAAQVAWARMYGGVHYASDVVAGARAGAAIASDVLRRAGVVDGAASDPVGAAA